MATVHAEPPFVQPIHRPQLSMTVGGVTYALERWTPSSWDNSGRRWLVFPPGYDFDRDGLPISVARCDGRNRCSCGAAGCPHLAGLVALGLLPRERRAVKGGVR